MNNAPELNVVVYCDPGPTDEAIDRHSADFVKDKTTCELGGGLGYLVLVPADFERLWNGVDSGDARGTADSVLRHLGPGAAPFIDRGDDFIYGWVGDDQTEFGRMLLLQIVPRPHMLMRRIAEQN